MKPIAPLMSAIEPRTVISHFIAVCHVRAFVPSFNFVMYFPGIFQVRVSGPAPEGLVFERPLSNLLGQAKFAPPCVNVTYVPIRAHHPPRQTVFR